MQTEAQQIEQSQSPEKRLGSRTSIWIALGWAVGWIVSWLVLIDVTQVLGDYSYLSNITLLGRLAGLFAGFSSAVALRRAHILSNWKRAGLEMVCTRQLGSLGK